MINREDSVDITLYMYIFRRSALITVATVMLILSFVGLCKSS